MRINVQFDGVLLGATENHWNNRETGQSGLYYNVSVKHGGSVGELRCDREVYQMYVSGQLEDLSVCVFIAQFDDKYRIFRVIAVQPKSK